MGPLELVASPDGYAWTDDVDTARHPIAHLAAETHGPERPRLSVLIEELRAVCGRLLVLAAVAHPAHPVFAGRACPACRDATVDQATLPA